MKGIYKFHWDCGRAGCLEGIFTADIKTVADTIGEEIYFGEVLGKHSDVRGTLEVGDYEILTDDQEFIDRFEETMGRGTITGFNPLDYIVEDL